MDVLQSQVFGVATAVLDIVGALPDGLLEDVEEGVIYLIDIDIMMLRSNSFREFLRPCSRLDPRILGAKVSCDEDLGDNVLIFRRSELIVSHNFSNCLEGVLVPCLDAFEHKDGHRCNDGCSG